MKAERPTGVASFGSSSTGQAWLGVRDEVLTGLGLTEAADRHLAPRSSSSSPSQTQITNDFAAPQKIAAQSHEASSRSAGSNAESRRLTAGGCCMLYWSPGLPPGNVQIFSATEDSLTPGRSGVPHGHLPQLKNVGQLFSVRHRSISLGYQPPGKRNDPHQPQGRHTTHDRHPSRANP